MGIRSKMGLSDYERERDEAEDNDDDDDNDDGDFEDDKLDGFEFNLDELSLNDIDINMDIDINNNNENIQNVKNEISFMENNELEDLDVLKIKEKKMELNVLLNNARGLKKNTKMYINDIDDEFKEKYNVKNKIDEFYNEEDINENENMNENNIETENEKKKLLKKLKLPKDFYSATDGSGGKKVPTAGVWDHMENMSLDDFEESEKKISASKELAIANKDVDSLSINDSDNICICQRCFRLQKYGQVEEVLRPGMCKNVLSIRLYV